MRFAIESWAPELGSPAPAEAVGADVPTHLGVEVPPDRWAPMVPSPQSAAVVRLVDGVRRVEARVWIEPDEGPPTLGICASWAAGAVRCDGQATIEQAQVRRALLCRDGGPEVIVTRHGQFPRLTVAAADADGLALALQVRMAALEVEVSSAVSAGPADLLVVDGPLTQRRAALAGAVGFVKTHQAAYLVPPASAVVPLLEAGQRTPLFRIGGAFERWSWYLRLPGPRDHGWSGVVRCELAGDQPAAEARCLADRASATLPAYASQGHKDPRAPQNLYPIAGLERELKHRLGDPTLWYRALRAAA